MTKKEILSALRAEVTPDGEILLDRLEKALKIVWVPELTFAAAVNVFGEEALYPNRKVRRALERLTAHALEVWAQKYGALNAEQADYADAVLASAVYRAESSDNKFASMQYQIGQMVNHEIVHEGFKKRGGLRRVEIA